MTQRLISLRLILPGLLVLAGACDRTETQSQAATPPPPEVTVATPLQKEITDEDEYTARLAAVNSVDIHSRVRGYLQSVHFKEGAIVNANDLLYIIDPRPYQALLEQARARLAQSMAAMHLAESDLERAERLFKSNTISREVYDSRNFRKMETAAAVDAAQAAVKIAQLDLEYTHIRAPITGHISKTRVTEGNLVKGGDMESTLLTTVVSLDPIYIYLTADEQTILRYLRLDNKSSRKNMADKSRPVFVRLTDEQEYSREGYIDFIDNQVDTATGTLEVRAVIPNPDLLLLPGMFAHVKIPAQNSYAALLIPDAAVNVDQTLQYVFVVTSDNVAERRDVTAGRKIDGLRVILAGLQNTDRVIINGIQRVRPGTTVNPRNGIIEIQAAASIKPVTP